LWYPKKVKVPQRVFVVDTGDLFGSWIPRDWIEKVIDVMTACDWHKYFLLTKNPKRYLQFKFPDHCWLGATVTGQKDAHRIRIMQGLNHPHKFLSVEPLFTPLTAPLNGLQWIVIGAMTGPTPRVPKAAWVDAIVKEAREVKAQIYLKDNLRPYYQGRTIYQQKP
jgi:protein gp37